MAKTRKQKHHFEGNAVPAGYCHTNPHYADGVNNYLNSNHTKYLAQPCADFFAFWKISATNLGILWRYLLTELQNVQCVVKYIQSSNRD